VVPVVGFEAAAGGVNPIPKDCRRCGLCCCSSAHAYIRVTGGDWTRLGEAADRLAHFIGNRAYMRMENGRCIALVSESAGGGADTHVCSIYEYRPQVCRDLQRGSPECEAELVRKAGATAGVASAPP